MSRPSPPAPRNGNFQDGISSPLRDRAREPIAIIGIGCRFPGGAHGPDAFWRLLHNGVDAICEVPADRWTIRNFYDPRPTAPGKTNACWGGFVEGVDRFDADFFNISPREAARMDPQQRLLLEVAWEAIEDAGVTAEKLSGSSTGVYVGLSSQDYSFLQNSYRNQTTIDSHTNTGGAMSIAANRVSYCLNLRGPSLAIDTACSSSLVGLHEACQSIWRGESELALSGGVNVLLRPEPFIGFTRLSMLSPDGRCKAFDASANGFVRSEGAGMLLLKPYRQALADGDPIYALIRGTAVNQDGRTSSLTVPGQDAQEALVLQACREAGISPCDVQYVEAHGTGTLVGDPIEAKALGAILAQSRPEDRRCHIGSVKTNIGHLEPAAGVAGVAKVALAMKHGCIPPNLHFRDPNPDIPFESLKLRVPTEPTPWSTDYPEVLAGVNSFGFGGTNAHVLLQQPPAATPSRKSHSAGNGRVPAVGREVIESEDPATPSKGQAAAEQAEPLTESRPAVLVPLSARGAEALKALSRAYREYLENHEVASLSDIAWTASLRRTHHDHRLAAVASSDSELCEALTAFAEGDSHPGLVKGRAAGRDETKLVFVCSGQGPQWWAMGRELLDKESVFRSVVEECDRIVRRLGDWSLLEELTAGEAESRIEETSIAQPCIFAVQVALARLWQSWGIEPDAVIGHSVGEVAAAYLAGALSFEDAVVTIFHRGRCMDFADAHGKMLAVGLPLEEAEHLLAGREHLISLAANNSPTSVTLSGDGEALEAIAETLEQRGVFNKFLRVQYAFHSPQMDPMQDELRTALSHIRPQQATLPIYSTVTGEPAEGTELDADYWWQNVRRPVRFAAAVDGLLSEGCNTFVELAPHPVLSGSISESVHQRRAKATIIHSLRRFEDERATMLKSLGQLYACGLPVDWSQIAPTEGRFTRLPTYQWQHERYWHESEESAALRLAPVQHVLLGRRSASARPTWENRLDLRVQSYLADHTVQGHPLLSATSFLEMALEAAHQLLGPGPCVLEDVELQKALFLPEEDAVVAQTTLNPEDGSFSIVSGSGQPEAAWTEHVKGIARLYDGAQSAGEPLDAIRARCGSEMGRDEAYAMMRGRGLEYGPAFQGVTRLWGGDGEALGEVEIPAPIAGTLEDYQAHPALTDACLQVFTGILSHQTEYDQATGSVYLPVAFDQVRVCSRPSGKVFSHVRLIERDSRRVVSDIRIYDPQGNLLLEMRGFQAQQVDPGGSAVAGQGADELLYDYTWQLRPRPEEASRRRSAEDFLKPAEICAATSSGAARLRQDLGLEADFQKLLDELDELCGLFVVQGLRDLGVPLGPGDRLSPEQLEEQYGVKPAHRRLLQRYFSMLAEDGVLRRAGEAWEVGSEPADGSPVERWREMLAKNPSLYAELTLLGRCATRLAAVLRGEEDALQLLFPDGSMAVAEHFYQDSLSLRYYNTLAQRAVSTVLENLPPWRDVRVLEIGAGTGGLTSYILPVLPPDRTRYVYTDLSNHFFVKAEEKFRDFPFVEYKRLDVEHDPLGQEFEPASFDIVLASECLHATADLRESLGNIKRLLASEGLLILIEAVRPPRFVDLVFGLTEGWWRFTDTDLRPDYAMLSMPRWEALLTEMEFSGVGEASGEAYGEMENAVIVARGPRFELESTLPTETPLSNNGQEVAHPGGGKLPGTWLIFGDRGGIGDRLAALLAERGESCVTVAQGDHYRRVLGEKFEMPADRPDDIRRLLEEIEASDLPALRGVVHLWNCDAPENEEQVTAQLAESLVPGTLHVMQLGLQMAELDAFESPRLWIATRNSQLVGGHTEGLRPMEGSVWGLARVMINELPKLRTALVDLSAEPSDAELLSLCDEFRLDEREDELALREQARYVRRMLPASQSGEGGPNTRTIHNNREPYRLETARAGTFDKLLLRACDRHPPGPGQVEIQVQAAGLNFADVMKALGLYPGLPDGPVPLGGECSGTVVAVGPDVTEFAPGDEVVAAAPFSFGSFVTTTADLVAHKPPHVRFEEGATIPVTFMTSHYGLNYLGRMSRGEKVLIHSATGGVGLAAIQLARLAGAEIFATAGTPEKRAFLRALGIQHVMDSRSLAFADEVLEATGGRGVDLVLNSLAGQAIQKGMSILADYGRFLEIGKRDIYGDSRLRMRPFRKNLGFFAIDLDAAMRQRTELCGRLLREVMQHMREGRLAPLPHRVFPISNAVGAFRHMSQAKHIGKVVLSTREAQVRVAAQRPQDYRFRSDATYLLTGGLGGFGLKAAQWMIEHGARHLVLMGRSGAKSAESQAAVEAMRAAGATVKIAQADVTDREQVAACLRDIKQNMPPLRGVMHAAMVLRDNLVAKLDEESFRAAWHPKVLGAWNLHTLTRDCELDFFVLFSSVASLFGSGGQANYAAANAFLDGLAHYRRSLGLPALSVNWGFIGEVGWAAQHDDVVRRLESQGLRPVSPAEGLRQLGRLLSRGTSQAGIIRVDWHRWGEAGSRIGLPPRFADLIELAADTGEQAAGKTGSQARKALLGAAPEERAEMMQQLLTEQVARVLGRSAAKIDADTPLTDLGLDSLMSVELRNWIEGDLQLSLPTVELMRGPTVAKLADVLCRQMDGKTASPIAEEETSAETAEPVAQAEASASEDAEQLLSRVDELGEEDVDALLEQLSSEEEEAT